MTSITSVPNLWDPDAFAQGPPHALFDELRRTEPVFWQEMPDEPGFWAVLTPRRRRCTSPANPMLFSASEGGVVLEDLDPANLEMMRDMLLAMDPPRHIDYRRPLAPSFKAARHRPAGGSDPRPSAGRSWPTRAKRGDVEFVHDVASLLPSAGHRRAHGPPPEDWAQIHGWPSRTPAARTPTSSATRPSSTAPATTATIEMAMYAMRVRGAAPTARHRRRT